MPLKRRNEYDTDTANDWKEIINGDHTQAVPSPSSGRPAPTKSTPPTQPTLAEMGNPVEPGGNTDTKRSHEGRLGLSELAAQHEWIEIYNSSSHQQSVDGWQLDDSDPATLPITLHQSTLMEPYGFLVVQDKRLHMLQGDTIRLLRPDGSIVDSVTTFQMLNGTSWSRYPVHGGGWHADTPQTPGDFNQAPSPKPTPAPETEPIVDKAATGPISPPVAPRAVSQQVSRSYTLPLGIAILSALVLLLFWRRLAAMEGTRPQTPLDSASSDRVES
jgi:hypothetical protein